MKELCWWILRTMTFAFGNYISPISNVRNAIITTLTAAILLFPLNNVQWSSTEFFFFLSAFARQCKVHHNFLREKSIEKVLWALVMLHMHHVQINLPIWGMLWFCASQAIIELYLKQPETQPCLLRITYSRKKHTSLNK